MALTGAQLLSVVSKVGATGGFVAGVDQLAAGANDALRRIGVKSPTEAALFLATMAEESGYFRTTTEYGSGQSYAPYIGRTFEQLTWSSNYAGFGSWCKSCGLVTDANIFVKNPTQLSNVQWAWLGGVYFWTQSRSWGEYSSVLDVARKTGSILAVSKAVNVGNPNTSVTPYGMSARTTMFQGFLALGQALMPGTVTASTAPPTAATTTTTSSAAPATAPAGYINAPASKAVAAANALWNLYKGKVYCYNWPALKELGRSSEYWCADFVRLAIRKGTGYDWAGGVGSSGPAYCPAVVSGMSRNPLWHEVKYADAKGGDVVFYFHGSVAYHVGMVEFGPTSAGHDMQTIEGDTSTPGLAVSMSSGGTLAKKVRDDRYYTMRIFRPPYWSAPAQASAPTTSTSTSTTATVNTSNGETDVVDVVASPPDLTSFEALDAPDLSINPIDALNPSAAFKAAMFENPTRAVKCSAWLDGQLLMDNLPVDANNSKISVDATRTVRRQASLTFQPDPYVPEHQKLRSILGYPGVELRVEAGFAWGDYVETVPVFQGLSDTPVTDLFTGKITVESQDRMWLLTADGFTTPVASNPQCTFVDGIRFLITESDRRAIVIDLTGNTDTIPSVIWDAGPSSRIDAVMSLAAAIGAEVFKSPATDYYVIRPIAALGSRSKWTIRAGRDLVSLSETVDWSKVKNKMTVTSQRADQATIQGDWSDIDEDSPTRWGGPFGRRNGFYSTSLLTEREQCEAAAQAMAQRTIGGRISINWSNLANPLAEAGESVEVIAGDDYYQTIVDSFDLPLGSQAASAAQARSFSLPGVQ